jgi:hypothetical protein
VVVRVRRTGRVAWFGPPGGGRGVGGAGQTGGMQNSQPSGAKGFAVLVGIMVAIVLVIMAIAIIVSPH